MTFGMNENNTPFKLMMVTPQVTPQITPQVKMNCTLSQPFCHLKKECWSFVECLKVSLKLQIC